MSNYTAKGRSGGGLLAAQVKAQMTQAELDGSSEINVTYDRPITATALAPGNFQTQPGTAVPTTVTSLASNQVKLTFAGDVSSETDLDFSGNGSYFISPQTISIV